MKRRMATSCELRAADSELRTQFVSLDKCPASKKEKKNEMFPLRMFVISRAHPACRISLMLALRVIKRTTERGIERARERDW